MDSRLDYWNRLIGKVAHKGLETYVLVRLWSLVDDLRVKFVPQQVVLKKDRTRALMDLYLPQVNMAVEVYEPYHKSQQKKDLRRMQRIKSVTGVDIFIVDCTADVKTVHSRINKISKEIKRRVLNKGCSFKPWLGEDELMSSYHVKRDVLRAGNDDCFKNIDEICRTFGANVEKRGWRINGCSEPFRGGQVVLWWPIENAKNWVNEVLGDGDLIVEYSKNVDKRRDHVSCVKKGVVTRIVFYRHKDKVWGWERYEFMGRYHLDGRRSRSKCYWIRDLRELKISEFRDGAVGDVKVA